MIQCVGQVRSDGKPFVKITVDGKDVGQVDPATAMSMGTHFIMAGIEAERDAGVVRGMLDEGAEPREVNQMLNTMRRYRDSADPGNPDASITHPRYPS